MTPPGWDPTEGLLTGEEVASIYRVQPETVSHWARTGKIPAIRPGREWRYSRKWIRENAPAR